ncbi:lysine-rich arabinogalactan protein 19-like [Ischnura elegans]|uniref:lysine-rich arabinogalactan protein 19-like n=1 Tax=Ischnura elegans TaxID=197161 RepID=UPI001ED8821D|nr:lysine-rich arabinogalactan protein 19-like [Ischnura elegans]
MDEESNDSEANGPWSEEDASPPSSPDSNLPSSPESPPPSPPSPPSKEISPVPVNPVPASVSPGIIPSPLSTPTVVPQSDSLIQIRLPVEKLNDPNVRAILGLPMLQPSDQPASQDSYSLDTRKRRRMFHSPPLSPTPLETSDRFSPLDDEHENGPLKAPPAKKSDQTYLSNINPSSKQSALRSGPP